MADDNADAKVAAAVAVTAALFSPRLRGMLRYGAVHGLAGVLTAGDALASFARGVSRGMQDTTLAPAMRGASATRGAEALVGIAPPAPPPAADVSDAARPTRRARTRPTAEREPDAQSPAPPVAPSVATPSDAADA